MAWNTYWHNRLLLYLCIQNFQYGKMLPGVSLLDSLEDETWKLGFDVFCIYSIWTLEVRVWCVFHFPYGPWKLGLDIFNICRISL